MASLILLVVAAAWAAVLIPPLLRSRVENRPNSSVTDFRNQLSSLQRAMPTRTVSMRGMARPLAQSPLARPAAAGRPPLRSGVRTHGTGTVRSAGQQAAVRQPDTSRLPDVSIRRRSYEPGTRARHLAAHDVSAHDAMKRRRANVLFVLILVTACSVFLAGTTTATAMVWVAGAAAVSLCSYLFVLGQARNRESGPARSAARRADRRQSPRRGPQAGADDLEPARRSRREAQPSRAHRPAREHSGDERRRQPQRGPRAGRYSHAV